MMEEFYTALLRAALTGIPVEFGELPAGATFPAVVLDTVAETASHSHSGESTLHEYVLQVDCYGLTYASALALYRQAHAVMSAPPKSSFIVRRSGREGGRDEAIRPYRISADYRIFHAITQ